MCFREAALTWQGCHHRGLQELCQFNQFGRRFGIQDALAGMDDGPVGGEQCLGGAADVSGISLLQDHPWRLVIKQLFRQFRGCHILGNLQQDRAGPAGAQLGKSPAHQVWDALHDIHLFRPLGDGLVTAGGVEVRVDAPFLSGHTGGQQ